MDLQKELNEWADWFIPHDSKDFRDALELNSFHQLNIEKLLALNGVSEAYVFRKKDSWKAWFYAKHQAESALLEQFEINNKLVEQIEELKAKAQAVPEGFVLVNKKDLVKVLNCVTDDWLVDTDSFEEFKKIESLVQDEVNAMLEAQEPAND